MDIEKARKERWVNFRVKPELLDRLREEAKADDRPVGSVVREAVALYLERREAQRRGPATGTL